MKKTIISVFVFFLCLTASSEIRRSVQAASSIVRNPIVAEMVEVEWIQGDGNAYVLLPIEISNLSSLAPTIVIKYVCPCNRFYTPVFNVYSGSRSYELGRNNRNVICHAIFGNIDDYDRSDMIYNEHVLEIQPLAGKITEDNVEHQVTMNNLNNVSSYLALFARYNSSTSIVSDMSTSTIFWMDIYSPNKSELLMSLKAVRIINESGNKEGALFDNVSGQLFRNQGNGAFVIGPDRK